MTFDLAAVRARLAAITPAPWSSDSTKSEGSYGSGEDVHEGFDSYQVIAEVRGKPEVICDALNSTVTEVLVEHDGDDEGTWTTAHDEVARKNMEFVAAAPTDLAAACDEIERRRNTDAMIRNMIYNLSQDGAADMLCRETIVASLRGAIGLKIGERP